MFHGLIKEENQVQTGPAASLTHTASVSLTLIRRVELEKSFTLFTESITPAATALVIPVNVTSAAAVTVLVNTLVNH